MAMAVAEASMQLLEVSRVKVRATHREADVYVDVADNWCPCGPMRMVCAHLHGHD